MKILYNDRKHYKRVSWNYYGELVESLQVKNDVTYHVSKINQTSDLPQNFDIILLGFSYTSGGIPDNIIHDSKIPLGIILNKEYQDLEGKLEWIKNTKPNFVLTVHHEFQEMSQKTNIPFYRIMWSANTSVFKNYLIPYLYDFSITGVIRKEQTSNWRSQIYENLNRLENKKYRIFKNVRLQEENYSGKMLGHLEYAKVLSASKIFLATTSPADLISTRYFEAMAVARCLIITNRMSSKVFDTYLIEDFNCIMFDTLDEFFEKVEYYLEHEEARLKIVSQAYYYFQKNLTWKKQSENITHLLHKFIT
jgi:glycosyltransferase involved in cell wall biosynthesis